MKKPSVHQEIIEYSKGALITDLPLFAGALNILIPREAEGKGTIATEGTYLYYSPDMIERTFKNNPVFLQRTILHQMLHLLYLHPWVRGNRDETIWNLSCDIAVESIIDSLSSVRDYKSVKRALSYIRTTVYDMLKGARSPSEIYRILYGDDAPFGFSTDSLIREFYTDSHILWPKKEDGEAPAGLMQSPDNDPKKKWEREGQKTKLMDAMGKDSSDSSGEGDAGDILLSGIAGGKKQKSYRYFLRHFLSLNERRGVSPDEFDYSFYSHGLNLYRNIPLIEPVEAYEDAGIKDIIIAIDTSYSTSGDTVRSFLEETVLILKDEALWAKGGTLRIIQCDDEVRSDTLYSPDLDIAKELSEFNLKGGGNTDFRPVFKYVNELIRSGKTREGTGLLYFTDGKGTYPKKAPVYKTAFIYPGPYDETKVPPWAIQLMMEDGPSQKKD